MIKVLGFTCGTSIYFLGDGDNYIVEEPGQTLTFSDFEWVHDWLYIDMRMTYADWLREKKKVDRGDYIEDLMKQVVLMSEKEYEKGLWY